MKMSNDKNDPMIGNIRIEFGDIEHLRFNDLSFVDECKIKVFPYSVFESGEYYFSGNYFEFLTGRRGIEHQIDKQFLYYVNTNGHHMMGQKYFNRLFELVENEIKEHSNDLWGNNEYSTFC